MMAPATVLVMMTAIVGGFDISGGRGIAVVTLITSGGPAGVLGAQKIISRFFLDCSNVS